MASADEVILWKAPQPGRDAAGEVMNGFDTQAYPGNGPYFTTVRAIAEEYQRHYQAGLQAIFLSATHFDELLRQGIIMPDPLYPEGESFFVPRVGLAAFNNAIQQGTPNEFQP